MKRILLVMVMLVSMLMFGAVGCTHVPFPQCNDFAQGSYLGEIATKRGVCIQDVGNTLIVVNALAIGVEAYTAQQALQSVQDFEKQLDAPMTDVVFAREARKLLAGYPGLFELGMIYLKDFNTGRVIDERSRQIVQGWMQRDIIPMLKLYAIQ